MLRKSVQLLLNVEGDIIIQMHHQLRIAGSVHDRLSCGLDCIELQANDTMFRRE